MQDLAALDRRYQQQARWTAELRNYLCQRQPGRVLEVGCGTGVILSDMQARLSLGDAVLCGIDRDGRVLRFAVEQGRQGRYVRADGVSLPYAADSFDFVYCHYLLLWVSDPAAILSEMRRVLKPGGVCCAMAEPCYSALRASPGPLRRLAEAQRESLVRQGICPDAGTRLRQWFARAGFAQVEWHLYRSIEKLSPEALRAEVAQMAADTGMEAPRLDENAEYAYCVPTYYAIAVK